MGQIKGSQREAHVARHLGVQGPYRDLVIDLYRQMMWRTDHAVVRPGWPLHGRILRTTTFQNWFMISWEVNTVLQHAAPPGKQSHHWDELSNCDFQDWIGRLFKVLLHLNEMPLNHCWDWLIVLLHYSHCCLRNWCGKGGWVWVYSWWVCSAQCLECATSLHTY